MNKRIFIPVGHGGSDPGAVANGLKEAELNLTIAVAMKDFLEPYGYIVKLSRYKNENDDVSEEIRECNAFNPDIAASPHMNAGGGDGFEAIVSAFGNRGKDLARCIEKQVIAIDQNSRGVKTKLGSSGRDYFGIIRETKCPSIILEGAFVDNKKDISQFDERHELIKLGEAYAKGIMDYFKDDAYKKPAKPIKERYIATKAFPCGWHGEKGLKDIKAGFDTEFFGPMFKGQRYYVKCDGKNIYCTTKRCNEKVLKEIKSALGSYFLEYRD